MTARRMNNGWYVDFWHTSADGPRQRIRRRSPVQTKRGAEEYERQLRGSLMQPSEAKKKEAPTLSVFSREFLENYAVTNNKPSEVRMKRSIFKHHLLPAFGRTRIDEIGVRHIERYKAAKLKSGLSPKTVNNHLTILRRCLVVAHDWALLEHVPRVKWLKVPKPDFDFLDFEEAVRLVAAADYEWPTMILTAVRTGLRQGELLALRWDDVDLQRSRLVVRRADWRGHIGPPKNGRTREVPLSPEAVAALGGHRHLRGELVFCHSTGRAWTENELRRPLYRACKRAGIRRIGWHVLRHTFASHLVMRGVALKAVQELLGHATIEMTMRYAHLSPDVRNDAVRRLDQTGPYLGNEISSAR